MSALLLVVGLALAIGTTAFAVMPNRLRVFLMKDLGRTQARMERTGESNTYVSPSTDGPRFLRQLRIMALVAAVICWTTVIVLALAA